MKRATADKIESAITRQLVFFCTLGIEFIILRYIFGAGHTLSWVLAYVLASVQPAVSRIETKVRA